MPKIEMVSKSREISPGNCEIDLHLRGMDRARAVDIQTALEHFLLERYSKTGTFLTDETDVNG